MAIVVVTVALPCRGALGAPDSSPPAASSPAAAKSTPSAAARARRSSTRRGSGRRGAQRELGVAVPAAGDVDHGEEHVAELAGDVGSRRALGRGLVRRELGASSASSRSGRRTRPPPSGYSKPTEAARRCSLRASSRPGRTAGTSWKMPSRPSLVRLRPPSGCGRRRRSRRSRVAEDVGMAQAQLGGHARARRRSRADAGLLAQQGQERGLEEQVAELVEQLRPRARARARRRPPRRPPRRCAGRSRSPSARGPRGSRAAAAPSARAARRPPRRRPGVRAAAARAASRHVRRASASAWARRRARRPSAAAASSATPSARERAAQRVGHVVRRGAAGRAQRLERGRGHQLRLARAEGDDQRARRRPRRRSLRRARRAARSRARTGCPAEVDHGQVELVRRSASGAPGRRAGSGSAPSASCRAAACSAGRTGPMGSIRCQPNCVLTGFETTPSGEREGDVGKGLDEVRCG